MTLAKYVALKILQALLHCVEIVFFGLAYVFCAVGDYATRAADSVKQQAILVKEQGSWE